MFLGQIGQLIYLHSHITGDMGRRDRIALLRSPGGLSGTSWLSVAAQDEPLAQALVDRRTIGTILEGTAALLDLGETREGFMGLLRPSIDGRDLFGNLRDTLSLTTHPTAMAEARWIGFRTFRYMQWEVETLDTPTFDVDRFWAAAAQLDATGPFPEDVQQNWLNVEDAGPFAPQAGMSDWLAQGAFMAGDPLFAPIRAMCEATCPEAVDACMFMINRATPVPIYVNGYSPAEWAVPTQTYRMAPRFNSDILREGAAGPLSERFGSEWREMSLCRVPYRTD